MNHNDPMDDDARMWQQALRDLERQSPRDPSNAVDSDNNLSIETLQSYLYLPAYDRHHIDPISGDEVLSYRQSGLSDRQAKKIFKHPFQAYCILDLHHLPGQQAYDGCQYALVAAYLQRQRKVRIICGFGHHNQGLSLMKAIAVMILQRASFVLAYQSADRRSGGTGAIDIYLKQSDR